MDGIGKTLNDVPEDVDCGPVGWRVVFPVVVTVFSVVLIISCTLYSLLYHQTCHMM